MYNRLRSIRSSLIESIIIILGNFSLFLTPLTTPTPLPGQDEEEDTVKEEVFKKTYIPRVLDEVRNFEQDLNKVTILPPIVIRICLLCIDIFSSLVLSPPLFFITLPL